MKKPIIVTKVKVTQFSAIQTLAESVYESMLLNTNFISPQPTMPVLLAAKADLSQAIEKWGQKGNRGSHVHYMNLKKSSDKDAQVAHLQLLEPGAWSPA